MNLPNHPRLLMVLTLIAFCSLSKAWPKATVAPKEKCTDDQRAFDLEAGGVYEAQQAFEKAEKEYLAAGESPCLAIRQQALVALKRIISVSPEDNELQLGQFYESQGMWMEAEAHFSKAAENTASPVARVTALNGLWRVRNAQSPFSRRLLADTNFLLIWGGFLARILVVAVLVWIFVMFFVALGGNYRALVIRSFKGEKSVADRLSVAFPAVRARVSSTLGATRPIFLPEIVRTVYPFVSPRLTELLPNEAFEMVGIKVPGLGQFLGLFARPRFEVHGGS